MPIWDEMVDGAGGIRRHWGGLCGQVFSLGITELAVRAARLDQAVEEGAAIHLGAGTGMGWACDPLPMLLPSGEFDQLARGLAQRAALLEAVLDDVYGAQSLVADGLLPSALVYANPGFLRPLHPRGAGGRRSLLVYSADLVRDGEGSWRVVADRADDASGAGYARETRDLLARYVPELFRGQSVAQLRPFFESWSEALRRQASLGTAGGALSFVLLTPGISTPQWFEHMVLSRELSCPLVEARDLTVRDGALFLRTLRGLQPVGCVLRATEGRSIDPLEVSDIGPSGVAGVLTSIRDGKLLIINDPGAGMAEAPGLASFLPRLCRHLLGEALELPGIRSAWLGDPSTRQALLQQPAAWVLRSALDGAAASLRLRGMPDERWQQLRSRIEAQPWAWAAISDSPASVAPTLRGEVLDGAPIKLRMFLMHDGVRWRTLEGGVCWRLQADQPVTAPIGAGTVLKDVWVLRDEAAAAVPTPVWAASPMPVRRMADDLPARIADDFYWLGRYVERLEGAARLAATALVRLGRAKPLPRDAAETAILRRTMVAGGLIDGSELPIAAMAGSLTRGPISGYLDRVVQLAGTLRHRLTTEMHSAVSQALVETRGILPRDASLAAVSKGMSAILRLSAMIAGLAAENMVRGGGWLFLDLGRRIERAAATASHLAGVLDQPVARVESALQLVLELCDSVLTYRHRYGPGLQLAAALDLALADLDNPRALAFQFAAAGRALELVGAPAANLPSLAAGLAARTAGLVEVVAAAHDPLAEVARVVPALRDLAQQTGQLSDSLVRQCFTLLPVSRSIAQTTDAQVGNSILRGAA